MAEAIATLKNKAGHNLEPQSFPRGTEEEPAGTCLHHELNGWDVIGQRGEEEVTQQIDAG